MAVRDRCSAVPPAVSPTSQAMLPAALLAALLGVGLWGCGCSPAAPPAPSPAPQTPVRRLTAEELNRTLRDLFPRVPASEFPELSITEDNGNDFAQEHNRQVVSDLYVEQLRAGINLVAHAVFVAADPRVGAADEDAAVVAALAELLPRAFRRPVTATEVDRFSAFYLARKAEFGFVAAWELVLQSILQSPNFLYRLELDDGHLDDEGRVAVSSVEMATRLSYFLWGTLPDDELLQAGIDGELTAGAPLAAQARRLLADPRALHAIQSFHRQWLDFDRVLQMNKSQTEFPRYNESLKIAMRDEASRFIESVFFAGDATLHTLLTSRQTRLGPALGALYGVDVDEDDQLVTLPPERAGILTQAQFLAARAHAVSGSPVLRGVFVLDRLICEPAPAPGGDIDTTPPQPEEDGAVPRTNRDRYRAHAANPACAACHASIDSVGFGFEGFDAIGQFRSVDNGAAVDASGSLDATAVGGTFSGAAGLGEALAASPVVSACVARHWFRFANGRREEAGDDDDLTAVNAAFDAAGGDVRVLLAAIVQSEAFRTRRGAP